MIVINDASSLLLLVSTAIIGFVHALAPDHWVPFVSMARARNWSTPKLVWVTLGAGLAHVCSSILIGSIGLFLGFSLTSLESLEFHRAKLAGSLLLVFGLVYAFWGFKRAHGHNHGEDTKSGSLTVWALLVVFLFGPCEPLIPLMFAAVIKSWAVTIAVCVLFTVITLLMMVVQVLLIYRGVAMMSFPKLEAHGHTIAGLVVVFTGAAVMVLSI